MAAALYSSYGPPQHDSMTKHNVPPQNYSRVAWGRQKHAPSIDLVDVTTDPCYENWTNKTAANF